LIGQEVLSLSDAYMTMFASESERTCTGILQAPCSDLQRL